MKNLTQGLYHLTESKQHWNDKNSLQLRQRIFASLYWTSFITNQDFNSGFREFFCDANIALIINE